MSLNIKIKQVWKIMYESTFKLKNAREVVV